MRTVLRYVFAAVVIAFGAEQALAQPVNGCPAGEAMQSSDPSGRKITCVPVTGGEADIIGKWAVTGSTTCLVATGGFNTQFFSPVITSTVTTTVSQLAGTFLGTRTFYAGGSGRSVGTTHTVTFPGTNYGAVPGPGPAGSANTATLDAGFKWTIESDGRLLVDDDNSIPQPITSPSGNLGLSVTLQNVPPFAGYISKDKRTIVMTHAGMAMETSELHDANGQVIRSTPRFCARSRVLTRLP